MWALVKREIERARAARAALDGRPPPRLIRPAYTAADVAPTDVDELALVVMRRVLRVLGGRGLRRRWRRPRAAAGR